MNENTLYRMSIKLQRKKGGIKQHNTNTIPSSNFFKREIYYSKNKLNDITFSSEEKENFFSIDQSYSLPTSPSHPSESPTSHISKNPPFGISTLAPSIMPSLYPIDFPTYRSCDYNDDDDDVTKEIIKFDYEVVTASTQVDAVDALKEVERGLFKDVSDSLLNCNVRMLSVRLGNSVEEENDGSLIAIDSKPLDVIDREQNKCQKPMVTPNPGPCIRINGAITTTTCSARISPKDEVLETIKQVMSQNKFRSEKVLRVSFVGDENTNRDDAPPDNTVGNNHPNNSETSHDGKGKNLVLGGIVVISIGAFVSILLLVKIARWKKFQRRIRRKRLEEDNERRGGGGGERVGDDDNGSNTTVVMDDCYADISPFGSGLTVSSTSLELDTRVGDDIMNSRSSDEMGRAISFDDAVRKNQKDNNFTTCPITRIGANATNNKKTHFSFDAKPPNVFENSSSVETGFEYGLDSINENSQENDNSQSPKSIDSNNVSIRSESTDRESPKQSDPDDDDLLGLSVLSDSTVEKVVTGSIASTTTSRPDRSSQSTTTSLSYCLSPSFSFSSSSPNDHHDGQPRVDIYISPSIINSLSSTNIVGTPPTPNSGNHHRGRRDDDARRKPSTPTLAAAAAQDDVEFSSPNFSLSTFSSGDNNSPMTNFDSSMGSSPSSNELSSQSASAAFANRKIEDAQKFWATDVSFSEKREI